MDILENARKHFDQGRQSMDVPEWGDGKNPAVIYWDPVTLMDRNDAVEKAGGANLKFHAYMVIRKAKDADGNRIFKDVEASDFFYKVDPGVVVRISNSMLNVADVEGMEKK